MKALPTKGRYSKRHLCLVDDEDYERFKDYYWYVRKDGYVSGRAKRADKLQLLHRAILEPPRNLLVDHVNGNPLDNRRANLRLCTYRQNSANSRTWGGANTYRNISWVAHANAWRVRFSQTGEVLFQLYVKDLEEAIHLRNDIAVQLDGEFAVTV